MGDIFGNVFRPAFGGVEGDDADRIAVLAGQQVLDDRFEIGRLVIGFAPGAAYRPKSSATKYTVSSLSFGTIEGVQPDLRIMNSTQCGIKFT